MEKLKEYLEDCEGKRRRMRNRPSDAVLLELRKLLARMEEAREEARSDSPPDEEGSR